MRAGFGRGGSFCTPVNLGGGTFRTPFEGRNNAPAGATWSWYNAPGWRFVTGAVATRCARPWRFVHAQHPERNELRHGRVQRPLRSAGQPRQLAAPVGPPGARLGVHHRRPVAEQFEREQQRHTAPGPRRQFVDHPVRQPRGLKQQPGRCVDASGPVERAGPQDNLPGQPAAARLHQLDWRAGLDHDHVLHGPNLHTGPTREGNVGPPVHSPQPRGVIASPVVRQRRILVRGAPSRCWPLLPRPSLRGLCR